MSTGRRFFRLLEGGDSRWTCKRGRQVIDTHDRLDAALRHAHRVAARHQPGEVFLHRLDGSVKTVEVLDLTSKPEKIALSRSH